MLCYELANSEVSLKRWPHRPLSRRRARAGGGGARTAARARARYGLRARVFLALGAEQDMPRYWVERYVRCTQRKRKWQLKKTAYNEAGLSEGMDGHTVTRTRGGRTAAARCARGGRAGAPSAAEVAPWSDGALVAPQVAARSRNDCATAGA